jgi:hypothetical protein
MKLDDFERNADGSVKVYPLAGWGTFLPFEMMCGLMVNYAASPSQAQQQAYDNLPLIMTPSQARELAGVLTRLADMAERPASPQDSRQ